MACEPPPGVADGEVGAGDMRTACAAEVWHATLLREEAITHVAGSRWPCHVCMYMNHKVVSRAHIFICQSLWPFLRVGVRLSCHCRTQPGGSPPSSRPAPSEIVGSGQFGEALELTSRLSSTRAPRPGRRKSAKSGTCRWCYHLGYLQMLTRPGTIKQPMSDRTLILSAQLRSLESQSAFGALIRLSPGRRKNEAALPPRERV